MGRSGTTLLLSLLSRSASTHVVPELPITLYNYHAFRKKNSFTEGDIDSILEIGNKFKFAGKLTVDVDYLKTVGVKSKSYTELLIASYLSLNLPQEARKEVKQIVVKNPTHTFYARQLQQLFPDTKFVVLVRHPFAYVNSCIESVEIGKKKEGVEFYSAVYHNYATEILSFLKELKDTVLIVKYEDLVTETRVTLQQICAHLSIPFEEEMLVNSGINLSIQHNYEQLTEHQKERVLTKFSALSAPVNTSRVLSWQGKLSERDCQVIARISKNAAAKLGYDISSLPNDKFGFLLVRLKVKLYFLLARYFFRIPIFIREIWRKNI